MAGLSQIVLSQTLHEIPCRRKRQRGMALAAGMLVMLGILSLVLVGVLAGAHGGGGLLNLTENGDQSASRQGQSTAAYNAADSGVEYTLQWMSYHSQKGPLNIGGQDIVKAFPLPAWDSPPDGPAATYTLDSATFTAWIFPDAANGQETVKKYLIQSTGLSGGASETVQAYVSVTSFGKYAVFLDKTPPGAFFASGSNVFDGPVHSNNANNPTPPAQPTPTGELNNIVWSDGTSAPVAPIFTYKGSDAFTVSGPSVNWYRNSYGNTSAPTSEAQWDMIASGGSGSIQTGVSMIPLPATGTLNQQYAVMGLPPPPPGTTAPPPGIPAGTSPVGVQVPSSGGVTAGGLYIHGPVQQMNLSVDPNNSTTQIIQIQQTDANKNPYTTTITMTPSAVPRPTTQVHVAYMNPAGSGTFTAATTDHTYTGVTNGVVYCDSNIGKTDPATQQGNDPTTQTLVTNPASGGVTGVVADGSALTLVTDSGHNVNINGNVTYHTPRQKDSKGNPLPESDTSNDNFRAYAGTFGIVSNNVQIVDKDASGNAITNLEVDAAVMALGTYDAADYASRPVGKMTNMGTYIVENRGLFSTANGLNVVSGIACSRFYDNRLADHPPPFFPTTSSQYQVLSWQRV